MLLLFCVSGFCLFAGLFVFLFVVVVFLCCVFVCVLVLVVLLRLFVVACIRDLSYTREYFSLFFTVKLPCSF